MDSTRAVAPLQKAKDAVELVTDGLGIDLVIQQLVDLFRQRVPEEAWPVTSLSSELNGSSDSSSPVQASSSRSKT